MKKILILLFGLIVAFLNVGCASIISDSDYPVTFQAQVGQKYTVKSDTGQTMLNGVGTQTITLKAGGSFSCNDYMVDAGCNSLPVNSGIDGWVFGNIIFGGLIGLVVDPATGAACTLPKYAIVPVCAE